MYDGGKVNKTCESIKTLEKTLYLSRRKKHCNDKRCYSEAEHKLTPENWTMQVEKQIKDKHGFMKSIVQKAEEDVKFCLGGLCRT